MQVWVTVLETVENRPGDLGDELDLSWQNDASCKRSRLTAEQYSWFFPEEYLTPTEKGKKFKKAKAICRTCPVKEPCLDYAMRLGSTVPGSVWGGLSGRELQRKRTSYFRERGEPVSLRSKAI